MHDLILILSYNLEHRYTSYDDDKLNLHTQGLWLSVAHTCKLENIHREHHQAPMHHTLALDLHVNLQGVWTICSSILVSSTHKQLQPNQYTVPLSSPSHVPILLGVYTLQTIVRMP